MLVTIITLSNHNALNEPGKMSKSSMLYLFVTFSAVTALNQITVAAAAAAGTLIRQNKRELTELPVCRLQLQRTS